MSIELESGEPSRARRAWLMILVFVPLIYLLGALSGAALYAGLDGVSANLPPEPERSLGQQLLAGLEHGALRKGPHRLVRRCAMLWMIPFLPLFLRELRWRGAKDSGWQPDEGRVGRGSIFRQLGAGYAIGLASLGVVGLLAYATQARYGLDKNLVEILRHALRVSVQCLVVGVLEETLVRGVLLRGLARIIRFWPAALVSSLLFSTLHFMRPAAESMSPEAGILANAFAALGSLFTPFVTERHIPLQWVNLTLMGLCLCVVYRRMGTIWLGAGLHAGWVWVKLMNGYLSNANREQAWTPLIGSRSDATDSLICTAILLAIAAWALRKGRKGQGEPSGQGPLRAE